MNPKMRFSQNVQRRSFVVKIILLVCVLALSFPPVAHAQGPPWPSPPVCNEGSLDGQLILICVPPTWNGQLVVYAHGYVAPQLPLALPAGELGRFPSLINVLLSGGYAFATSSYSKNGYAVEQAGGDLNALVDHFKTLVHPIPVQKVFVVGASEGGLITTMLVEEHPEIYNGGLAMCGPIGGMPYQIQYLADFRVVFDAFFRNVFRFGVTDVPEDAFLSWEDAYVPTIAKVIRLHPKKTRELFDVTDAAHVLGDPTLYVTTAQSVLFYSIWGTNDLIATAGGMPYDNQDAWYEGSHNDVALNARVERVRGDTAAQGYIGTYYQPTGELERPLVTLHNTLDPVVPYQHEELYAVKAAPSGLFYPIPVEEDYGHCVFTADEVFTAFQALVFYAGP